MGDYYEKGAKKRRKGKNYAGIDEFRFVAALLVIAIHVSPFSDWNEEVDFLITYCLGRVAVPFFFMTTGYFVLAPYIRSGFRKNRSFYRFLAKNVGLYLAAGLFYLPVSIYSGNVPHSAYELAKQIFFDGTFYHLWYFPAVVMGCILVISLARKSLMTAVVFSASAYVIGLFGDSYYGVIEGIPLMRTVYGGIFGISSYTRNGIFFAPLYLVLGVLLAISLRHVPKAVCRWGLFVSLALMLLEGDFTYRMGYQRHNSMYLFLIPVMYFLFQILLEVSGRAPGWLRKSTMLIYILHPAVIILVRGAGKILGLTGVIVEDAFIQYILVCVLSVGMALGINNINMILRIVPHFVLSQS